VRFATDEQHDAQKSQALHGLVADAGPPNRREIAAYIWTTCALETSGAAKRTPAW
jgi:hypothetical protein